MTVWMFPSYNILYKFWEKLSHLVYSLAQTGNLPGGIVLVINALGSSHLDGLGCSLQFSFGSSLVPTFNSGQHLLHSCLYAGADGFIPFSLGAVYQNSLLCGFDISQDYTSNYETFVFFFIRFILARHGGLR